MLIWLVCALVITGATCFYFSRKGVEKAEIYKALAACGLFAAAGGAAIEVTQYQQSAQSIAQDDRDALRRLSEEPAALAASATSFVPPAEHKATVLEPELNWENISASKVALQNPEQFTHSQNAPFVNYRAEFVNKTKKIIVGVELEVVNHNCASAGEDKKNCPAEGSTIVEKRTNIIVPPNGHIPVGTYAPINGEASNYFMEVKVARVVYFEGSWPKNKPLVTATDVRLLARGEAQLDPTPTCAIGEKLNAAPLSPAGIADGEFASKPSVRRC